MDLGHPLLDLLLFHLEILLQPLQLTERSEPITGHPSKTIPDCRSNDKLPISSAAGEDAGKNYFRAEWKYGSSEKRGDEDADVAVIDEEVQHSLFFSQLHYSFSAKVLFL